MLVHENVWFCRRERDKGEAVAATRLLDLYCLKIKIYVISFDLSQTDKNARLSRHEVKPIIICQPVSYIKFSKNKLTRITVIGLRINFQTIKISRKNYLSALEKHTLKIHSTLKIHLMSFLLIAMQPDSCTQMLHLILQRAKEINITDSQRRAAHAPEKIFQKR